MGVIRKGLGQILQRSALGKITSVAGEGQNIDFNPTYDYHPIRPTNRDNCDEFPHHARDVFIM